MRKIITILLLFSILLLNLPLVKSNSQGPNNPKYATNDDTVGSREWLNTDYVFRSDNKYTYVETKRSVISYYLFTEQYDFNIPSSATITGIKVEVEKRAELKPPDYAVDYSVRLLKGGTLVGDDKADTSTHWPSSDTYVVYGGENDLWGTTWTPDDINDIKFGVAISVDIHASEGGAALIDHVRITVYYSAGNNPPTISNEYPANDSVGVELRPTCHVTVSDADGDLMTVRFYENTTGSWVLRQTNTSVSSDSTVYWRYTQAEEPETTYWWKVEATDGTDTTTKIFHFTTEAKPTIIFAGNPGDKGGPYCIPPTDNITTGGPYAMEGYYTNDSYQEEDWIYINITSSPGKDIHLHWYDATTDTWDNSTSYKFIETGSAGSGKSYYEFNTSGNITITHGHKYSFDVVQNTFVVRWEKIGADDKLTRRYVYLGCTPDNDNFEYKPFYCYNASYSQDTVDNYHLRDILHHDQGIDGTVTDTGYLLDGIPTDDIQYRHCSIFMAFWFDETVAISDITLENIYQHFWWNVSFWTSAGWNKSRDRLDNTITDGYVPTPIANTSISCCGYTFNLSCHKIVLSNPVTITDNNVYEICGLKLYAGHPKVVSNRSFTSFVIFNVPDNSTLQTLDTDNDGLNDYQELYVYYTNPFLADTDNDGHSDYNEINAGTNPNVYTDYPANNPPVISNEYPVNGSTGIELRPNLHIDVSDDDGDIMNITWLTNISNEADISSLYDGFTSSLVGYADKDKATRLPKQQNGFYACGRFWVFYMQNYSTGNYSTGYRTSTDGETWSEYTHLFSDSYMAYTDIEFDGEYIHMVYTKNEGGTSKHIYRRGKPLSDGTIMWDDEQEFTTYSITDPSITVDSEGYPWIASGLGSPTSTIRVYATSTKDGTWTDRTGYPKVIFEREGKWDVILVSLTEGKLYAVIYSDYNATPDKIYGRLYDGSTWQSLEEVSTSNVANGYYCQVSAVSIGDDVHLVFTKDGTNDIVYMKRTYGSGWSSEQVIYDGHDEKISPILSRVNSQGDNLICFWMENNHIYYKKCVNGVWDSTPTEWIDESADGLTSVYDFGGWHRVYGNQLGLLYQTNANSPYKVKFNHLQFNETCWTVFGYNNSVYNGTYYQTNDDFNQYNTTYWWKVEVDDGTSTTTAIFHFTTDCLPSLTNPSATPSSGIADYTIFYFNITYSDQDGDPPVEIKVNISKPGWYINVTMTYISGDNTTGALYTYSTTLSTGVYDYLFYASDGKASTVNDPTDQVTVMGQSISFTVSTADPSGQENFTASATMGAEWNVDASYQTSSIPAIQITNTGNVPINISINLTTAPISNVHIKYNTSSTPPPFTTDPYSCDKELTTTPVQVGSYIQPGDTLNIWLWADFENKYNPGEYITSLYIESSGAT